MSVLAWIIATTLFGGTLSVLFAAVLTLNTRASWVQMLISYAIGALLGAAFLNALPEALDELLERGRDMRAVFDLED